MERTFRREILYIFTISLSIILLIHNILKDGGKEILPIFLGSFLGILSFEMTYHFVNFLTGVKKRIKLKILFFFFLFLLISFSIIFISNSIIYTILGFSTFVVSLFIMVFKEILNA